MRVKTRSVHGQATIGSWLDPGPVLRLDIIQHPYGPCPAAMEALSSPPEAPYETLATRLRRSLAEAYQVPFASIVLLDGVDRVMARLVNNITGPRVGFPPSTAASIVALASQTTEPLWIARGPGHHGTVAVDAAADLPVESIAIVDSPSDPLGSMLSPSTAVRLARACRSLVIDERYAEFAGLSALPLSLEFENIVVLRSFETWAGIQDPPCAWAVASQRTSHAIGLEGDTPEPEAIAAAIATLENLGSVAVTLKLLREERSRLYRFLRKLSFLEPIPSWGPFLAARVDLVPRESIVSGLLRRGISIHAPSQPGLDRIVRFGLGSRSAMDRLRNALLDLAPELVG